MNYVALKTEITTDPAGLAYGAVQNTATWDNATADKLNAVGRTGEQKTLTAAQIFECIDQVQYAALTTAQQDQVRLILSLDGDIPVGTGTNAYKWYRAIFPTATPSRTAFNQATARQVSRAVELGLGDVTPTDVAIARQS